jgi:hypothetical protein
MSENLGLFRGGVKKMRWQVNRYPPLTPMTPLNIVLISAKEGNSKQKICGIVRMVPNGHVQGK